MTKILMYTVRPDERAAIDAWVAANDIQVIPTRLNLDRTPLI